MKVFSEQRGSVFVLITPEELAQLPDGTVLQSINHYGIGVKGRKGDEYEIDMDTRFGLLAYGFELPCFNHDKIFPVRGELRNAEF